MCCEAVNAVIQRQIIECGLGHIFHLFHFTLYGAVHCVARYDITDVGTELIRLPLQKRGDVDVHAVNAEQTKQAQNNGISDSGKSTLVLIIKAIYCHTLRCHLPSPEAKLWVSALKCVICEPSASYAFVFKHTAYTMMNFGKAIFQVLSSINLSSRLSVWFTQYWISLRGSGRYLNPRLWSPSPRSHFPIFSTPQHSSSSTCPAVVVDNNRCPPCIWESLQHKESALKKTKLLIQVEAFLLIIM